ncbi:MAG: zinc-ribbon domain-containing protein [Oscillospiraceae bacterium]|nr:zinc-ribbon domain-containing protein [Oscillospiraceae bacterium]
MALIKCPNCGNQMSDKAAACPHCGAPVLSKSNIANYSAPITNTTAQKTSSNKTPVIIGVCIAAAAIIGVLVFILFGNKDLSDNNQGKPYPSGDTTFVPSSTPANQSPETPVKTPKTYTVDMTVNFKNEIRAKTVDILIDGRDFASISDGKTETYKIALGEGTHQIEFRRNENYDKSNPKTYCTISLNVTFDKSVKYTVEQTFSGLKVNID